MNLLTGPVQWWLRRGRPVLQAALTRLVYVGGNVSFGPGLRADRVPRCLVDPGARLSVGQNVELRADVEIRVHGSAVLDIGDNVRIDRGVRILAANRSRVRIGPGTRIGIGSVLNGGDSITIGQDCLISGYVYLQTSMHRFQMPDRPIRDQHFDHGPVIIGPGAWIAAHAVVMPGITIGDNAIVGSNAVVTHDVPAMAIVAGVPARTIATRPQDPAP
jgi:acetyltransferase-like isoleucine patch superfamily enzyme